MAITRSGDAPAGADAAKKEPAKLPEDFKANEPTAKSGVDKDGKGDDTLSESQLGRAGVEALTSLRPQPSAEEIKSVLDALAEKDDAGQPKVKAKTAKEGGEKAVAELNKQRG